MGKSQFERPSPNFRHQFRSVDLSADSSHPAIVENPSDPAQSVVWRGEEDTRAFAEGLAGKSAIANCLIELRGNLGAGKTTFARYLLRALGVTGRIKSPTYTVVEPYKVAWPQRFEVKVEADGLDLWHFDFFRFSDPLEWEDAGFREVFAGPGLKLAEWPQNAGVLLPTADLVMEMEVRDDATREVRLTAQTAVGRELLA